MTDAHSERCCAYRKCGKPLVRRPDEKTLDWNRRRTCGRSCAASMKGQTMRERAAGKQEGPQFPRVTGKEPDYGAGFGAHNIGFRHRYQRIDRPPSPMTYGGVGSTWAAL